MNRKQLHKEFDEKFRLEGKFQHPNYEIIKSFYDKKIQEILQELVGEEIPNVPETIDMNNVQEVAVACRDGGWNRCRQEIIDKIKTLGYGE